MKVFFRTDASVALGTGHLMRCLALARALHHKGATIVFLCRSLPSILATRVAAEGYGLVQLPDVGDWQADAVATAATMGSGKHGLVVDHYSLGADWESSFRGRVACLLALDDAPVRAHDCDLLLDQNLHDDAAVSYLSLATGSRLLLGPSYALLRPEFADAHCAVKARSAVNRLLVSFGGSDPTDEAAKAHAILAARTDLRADIVLGPAYSGRLTPFGDAGERIHILRDPPDLVSRMMAADLALGAGGISSWERCCLGLPALCIAIAANQESVARACQAAGVLRYLGTPSEVTGERLDEVISEMRQLPRALTSMSQTAWKLVDGRGAERVGALFVAAMTERAA